MVLACAGYVLVARLVGVVPPTWAGLACLVFGFAAIFGLAEVLNARRVRGILAEKDVVLAHRRELTRALRVFRVVGPIQLLVAGAQALRASGLYAGAASGDKIALFDFLLCSALSLGCLVVFIGYQVAVPRMKRELELLR
jgi:hypothetical protein